MYLVSGGEALEYMQLKIKIITKTSLLRSWFKYAIILPFIVIGDLWTPKIRHCKI